MSNVLVDEVALQSIASAIREKNGTENTYKPAEMSQAILDIENGSEDDYQQGYNDGYEKAESVNPFYYATRLDNVMGGAQFPENYEAVIKLQKAPRVCGYLFNNCRNLKSVKMISEDQTNTVEFSNVLNTTWGTATLETVDLSEFNPKISSLLQAFRYQTKLRSILGTFDLSECTNVANAFQECSALEDIEFVPNTIKISIQFNYCDKLTDKSIQSIIDGLADLTGQTAQTLTLHATVGAKLTDEQKANITAKNWILAY